MRVMHASLVTILNEFILTSEPEASPHPPLHYSEDQPQNASAKVTVSSEEDQDNVSDQVNR